MREEKTNKAKAAKDEVLGSETVFEKVKVRIPWIFGKAFRKPKIIFPKKKKLRMGIPLPGKSIAVIGVYIILFLLQTGIVYLVFREVPALGSYPDGSPRFLYEDINEAYIIESVVASIFIFMCSIGFILLYQASKFVYNKRIAVRYLAVGIVLILASFIALQAMITIKLKQKLFNV